MATPQAQAETHQQAQEAMAAAMVPSLGAAWGLVDLNDLTGSLPRFRAALEALITRYGQASATAAVNYFRAARITAGVSGRVTIPPVSATPDGFIDALVVESVADAIVDSSTGLDALDAGAEQLVLDQGRRQLMSAAALDREAKGWARVPNAGACSFCLMLSLRGPAYKTKRSASFQAHDNCRCSVEPVFGHWEPTSQTRTAQRTWTDATKGRSGHDARVAFRQAVEGRPVTGAPSKSSRSKGKSFKAAQGKTPENQRAQLRVLEAMPPAKSPQAAEWRTQRIAEIRKYLGE